MAEKYFADQFDDEEVMFVFRKHPIVMRKSLIFCSFILLLGTVPGLITLENRDLGLGLLGALLLAILFFLPAWIKWHFSVYILTDQRFIQVRQKGLFHRAVSDISLNQIQSMNYSISGLVETMFGFGTIVVQTYMGDVELRDIQHPEKTQKRIQAVLRDQNIQPNQLNSADSEATNSESHE